MIYLSQSSNVNNWNLHLHRGETLVKSGYCNIYLDKRNLGQYKTHLHPPKPRRRSRTPGHGLFHLRHCRHTTTTTGRAANSAGVSPSVFLLEEALNQTQVQLIQSLGPSYHGNFQEPACSSQLNMTEDKVLLALSPLTCSEMSVAKVRRIYNREDSKALAKHLALSSHDASTPLKLLHNAAAHLRGPSRGIGAAVVGYLGVRIFSPKPPHQALLPIGKTPKTFSPV